MRQVDSRTGENGNTGCPVRVREDVVGQTAGVEDFQCSGHRCEGPARRVHVGPAFEDSDRAAAPGQIAGRGQSGGSGADDKDVHAV